MWTTLGQTTALAALQRAIESARPSHAYVFTGVEGLGKAHAALEFAAALNCTADGDRPCGECRACRDTLAGRHPDVELVGPGGLCDESDHKDHADSRNLRICQIRRLERIVSLAPYVGRHRVAILDAADSLQAEAANAFLKTLEEPPDGTIIVLLAEREDRLPETVLSRCQRVVFRRTDRETVLAALQERGAEPLQAEAIVAAAGGRIGWAFRALADPSLLLERTKLLDDAVRVAHADRVGRFAWVNATEGRGAEARERYQRALDVWEEWWRDVLLAGAGGNGLVNRDREASLREEGRLYPAGDVVRFLQVLLKTREYLYANVDPQLALENLMLDLPRAPSTGSGQRAGVRV